MQQSVEQQERQQHLSAPLAVPYAVSSVLSLSRFALPSSLPRCAARAVRVRVPPAAVGCGGERSAGPRASAGGSGRSGREGPGEAKHRRGEEVEEVRALMLPLPVCLLLPRWRGSLRLDASCLCAPRGRVGRAFSAASGRLQCACCAGNRLQAGRRRRRELRSKRAKCNQATVYALVNSVCRSKDAGECAPCRGSGIVGFSAPRSRGFSLHKTTHTRNHGQGSKKKYHDGKLFARRSHSFSAVLFLWP